MSQRFPRAVLRRFSLICNCLEICRHVVGDRILYDKTCRLQMGNLCLDSHEVRAVKIVDVGMLAYYGLS